MVEIWNSDFNHKVLVEHLKDRLIIKFRDNSKKPMFSGDKNLPRLMVGLDF
jgi:hypothetical protein